MESRHRAVQEALDWFDSGALFDVLARRVARPTQSQEPGDGEHLLAYLQEDLRPDLLAMGFEVRVVENPESGGPPFLLAERFEDARQTTVLLYGHGDVVRGHASQWSSGLSPWTLAKRGERWYGRGAADNKGQHTINLAALAQVLKARGRLGVNVRILFEMGEEVGSPGLRALCERERDALRGDVFIASDGPRLTASQPTLFLGSRGAFNFDLEVSLREGGHHSGNWGGLLANPGTILAHAITSLVDARGVIQVPQLRPGPIPESVREALALLDLSTLEGPPVDASWGEPGLSAAERVFGWNTLEVLALGCGNCEAPVNAIPGTAKAHLQLRFVVGLEPAGFEKAVRSHLVAHGFPMVTVRASRDALFPATRLDPQDPWVGLIAHSIEASTGSRPAILPNLGGSLPNDCFADILGMPTIWIPHSYPGCCQHAANEHLLSGVAREGLGLMVGLIWDLGSVLPHA